MRAQYRRQLVSLCEEHAILPARMILHNVHVSSYIPVAFGGYGTIYQAFYNNRRVAVKAVRRLADDGGKAQKVRRIARLRHRPRTEILHSACIVKLSRGPS
jgi:hypothetical protein